MKKWITALLGAVLIISITACGNKEGAENKVNAADPKASASSNAPATSGTPTVEELIQKSTEAGKDLKSFAMTSQISQNLKITQGDATQEQKVNIALNSEIIQESMQMHQEMVMDMGQGEQKMEQYIVPEGIYMLTEGQWVKMPSSMTEQMNDMIKSAGNPEKQLEQFKTIAKDASVSDEGDAYLLKAEVSGDGVKELAKGYLEQASSGNPQMSAMLDQMNIKSMNLSYAINKKTYLPTKTNVEMVMEVEESGQKINIDMKMAADLSKHNEIKEIKLPEEAKNAQEVNIPTAQ